ncbi:hemerythrin domain-containing protein [Streptosporangium canum]|uniref:hemerythrin domain-containing protein n=1 Tax=Streptosporangium canum TaxID=324952 RepID=UPI0037A83A87
MTERARAVGDELIAVHARLREQLATVRAQVDAQLNDPTTALPQLLSTDLKTHCLTFCDALHEHHRGEDRLGFPLLEEHFPELRPALEKLREEHVVVARIYHDLHEALRQDNPQRVRADLNRLTAELERHFDYEEEQLVTALNKLSNPQPKP